MTTASGNFNNPAAECNREFARILGLAGTAADHEFVNEIWEQRPARWEAPDFPVRLTLPELEGLFHDQPFRESDIRLVKGGEESFSMAPFLDQRGFIRPSQAWAEVAGGATLVLKHFDTRHPATRDVCRRLELLLHHAAIANLYVTPAGHQGLPLHQDFHDVLVCQLDGTKRWRVHERQAIPTENSPPFPRDEASAGQLQFEHTLRRGEIMYLPRGSHHCASAQQEASVHVTIGLHTKKWGDLMAGLVAGMMEKHEVFRRSLPPGFLADGWSPSAQPEWQEMLGHLGAEMAEAPVQDLRRRMLKWCSTAPAHLTDLGKRLRRTGLVHFERSASGGTLHLPGRTVEVSGQDVGFVQDLLASDELIPSQRLQSASAPQRQIVAALIRASVYTAS